MFGKKGFLCFFVFLLSGFLPLAGAALAAAERQPQVKLEYRLLERRVDGPIVSLRLAVVVVNREEVPLRALDVRLLGGAPLAVAGSRFGADEVPAGEALTLDGELAYSFDSRTEEPPQLRWELSFARGDKARETLEIRW